MGKVLVFAKKLFSKGFFHVAGSSVINKIVTAVTNILIARSLGKYQYGIFGAAFNIYSIFIIFSGFGMYAAVLVYCSENRSLEEKKVYYRYGLIAGFIASVVLSIAMFIYGAFLPHGIEETKEYIMLLAGLPLLDYLVQYFLVIYRSQKMNKKYALYTNILSITYFLLGCFGAQKFGISGTIIGRYIAYILLICIMVPGALKYLVREYTDSLYFTKEKIRDLWRYSVKNGISSALNQILYFIDIALLSALIQNPEVVASYKVAVLIPEGLSFIPTSIMVFLVPVIAEHNKDGEWLRKNIKKLFVYSGIFNLIVSGALVFFAPHIITLLWGPEYLDSVTCFRILSINYFFMATFRMTCTNVLAVLRKVNFNLILGITSGVLDIMLDYILIYNYSSIGAAIATLSTVLFIITFSVPYVTYSLHKI